MKNHTVEQGECLTSIADENGFFWQTLWNHPQNAKLKQTRQDPNILLAGDVVHVPDKRLREETAATGEVHRFRVKNIPAKLTLRLLFDDEPRRDEAFTMEIDGQLHTGKTNGDGQLSISILPGAKSGKLILGDGARRTEYQLQLGELDPINEISGVQARLRNLGFFEGAISGLLDDATGTALGAFQAFVGLPITGALDETTAKKLQLSHERV